ncbi:MAG: hypothetical protein LH631_14300 [Alkalinema sp. CAN_BIN05]|nr:hypothetical protein [Alkalinema sp. CAN_BIN05]
MAQDFEKTNLSWELKLGQQRIGEWFEQLTSGWNPPQLPNNTPRPEVPPQTWEALYWLTIVTGISFTLWKLYPLLTRLINKKTTPPTRRPIATPEPTTIQWLQQAKHAKANGDYTKATRALYFAALTRLKDREFLANDDSMTNGEYRTQLRQRKKSQKSDRAYQTLANAHEAIYYNTDHNTETNNSKNLGEQYLEQYEDCDRAYRDIEQETP